MTARSSSFARRRRPWSLGLALLSLAGCDISNCDDVPPAPSGQLDRISDLALVTPPSDGEPRSFLIAANPEIQQLRIFDVLEQRFVAAPNLYFPLSARTGPLTSRLAVASNDARYVLALDSAADLLQLISVETTVVVDEDTVAPAFTTLGVFPTGRAPADVAAWRDERFGLLAIVTLPAQSEVQIFALDVDAGTATELARVFLGEGAYPARIAIDPSGDAAVITDAALDSVAILRLGGTDAATAAVLDRRIDVGGTTGPVAIGHVDPGDGAGPIALVALQDQPAVAALRLYRGLREDRYTLLGSVELPELAAALYVPDQARTSPVACCALISADQVAPEAPTYAWATAATTSGFLYHLRFDGTRATDDGTLVRLIDFGTPVAGTLDDLQGDTVWRPGNDETVDTRPLLALTPIDNFGTPPRVPLYAPDLTLSLVYEGTPEGTSNRRGSLRVEDGGYVIDVVPGERAFADEAVQGGDLLWLDAEGLPAGCETPLELSVVVVRSDTVELGAIAQETAACLGEELRFSVIARGELVVSTSSEGYLGRLPLGEEPASLELPGLLVTVTASAAGLPPRGGELRVGLTQGFDPARMHLARQPDFRAGGFGTAALHPEALVGGPVHVRASDGTVAERSTLFLGTGTGGLFLMAEGEVSVDAVTAFD